MAVLRPDQSQLTIMGEVYPGADSEIIVPQNIWEHTPGSVIRGVFYTSNSTELTTLPSGGTFNDIVEALDPVATGAISCYVNPVGHLAVGDFIAFDTRDNLVAVENSSNATTPQKLYPYLDAVVAGGGVQPEIRKVERIEVLSGGQGLIYWDRPLAFTHYCYNGSNQRSSSTNLSFSETSNTSGVGSWGGSNGQSYYAKAAVYHTLAAGSTGQKFINLVPGVYETVDTPDFTPVVEPRYFLGTTSNRNFTSVYTGQHSYQGALNGMVLTNGWPLRFAIGKEVPKVFATYDTTNYVETNNTPGASGAGDPGNSLINFGYFAVGNGNSGETGELGLGLAVANNVGDVWICVTHNAWNAAAVGIGHYLLIDYTNMAGASTSNSNTTDLTNKIWDPVSTSSNNLEIRQIVDLGKDEDGTVLDGWRTASAGDQTTWIKLNYPLRYVHAAGGDNANGWGCRIMALAMNDTSNGVINAGSAFANTYIEHYIQETNDLDSISMHLHMKDSEANDTNDFDRRWIGGKVGAMSLVGEEGGLITCNWDSIVFLDMLHNQARHHSSTRVAGSRSQQLDPDVSSTTTSNMPGFAVMQNIETADVVYPTTQPYYFSRGSVKLLGTDNNNAVEFARIRSFTLSVNNNEDPRYYIKNRPGEHRGPAEIREQRREYSLNCTVALPDTVSAFSSVNEGAMALFKELLLEGRYKDASGHEGFHIELTFSRGEIEGASGVNDEIVIKIPGRRPGETLLSGYTNTATADIGFQGAFLRSAPHTIMTEAPFQVTCDFVFRNIDIMIRDREPFYP